MTEQQVVISEHASATEAGLAAPARVREGDELVGHGCFRRCRRARRAVQRSDGGPIPSVQLALSRSHQLDPGVKLPERLPHTDAEIPQYEVGWVLSRPLAGFRRRLVGLP